MSVAETEPPAALGADTAQRSLFHKIAWRLVPFLSVCYLFSQIDRVNISFAKFQMVADLNLSDTVYGLGAGIFFVGYCLFEVPSNIILKRVGAPLWLGIIGVTWGILSAATLFIFDSKSYYMMRFLLGVAEAGFFPGVIYYLTFWFPARQRSQVTGIFMATIAVSGVIVGPLSGAIMSNLDGWLGLRGWQLILLIEGLPAAFLGIMCWLYLDTSPAQATWLSEDEKRLLTRTLDQESRLVIDTGERSALARVLSSPAAWGISLTYFCYGVAFYGIVFWLPTMIKGSGVEDPLTIGLLTAIPWGVSIIVMIALASYAGRRGNSRRVMVALSVVSAGGFALMLAAGSGMIALVGLVIAMSTNMASLPLLWNLPTRLFSGASAAIVIGMIAAIGNFAGFFAPYVVGWSRENLGSFDVAMYIFVGAMLLASPLLLSLPRQVGSRAVPP